MLLSNLAKTINVINTYNFKRDKYFSSITSNSKYTNKSTLLVFDKNSKAKIEYIKLALKNKVPAIITNQFIKSITIPQFIVLDIDKEIEKLLKKFI